jgi:hypothetical protein
METLMYLFAFTAGVVGLYFAVAAVQRPRPAKILAAVLWMAYAVYEYYVANGTLCDANCNIRVDLLLFFPVLAFASIVAAQTEPRPVIVAILYVICFGMVALLALAFGYTAAAVIAGVGALIAAVYGIKSRTSGNRA